MVLVHLQDFRLALFLQTAEDIQVVCLAPLHPLKAGTQRLQGFPAQAQLLGKAPNAAFTGKIQPRQVPGS